LGGGSPPDGRLDAGGERYDLDADVGAMAPLGTDVGPDADSGPEESDGTIGTCDRLRGCIETCGADGGCQGGCNAQSSPEAYELYQAMIVCWGNHCAGFVGDPEAFDACVASECAAPTRACTEHVVEDEAG